MNEIYYCLRIYKVRNTEIQRGDIGYLEEDDLPEITARQRILLSDVRGWKGYVEPTNKPYFRNKEEKVDIFFKDLDNVVIIQKLEEFDKIMEQYISSKQQFNFN